MLTYEISTGQIYDGTMNPVGSPGYSGFPPHVNDADAIQLADIGPIPTGLWNMVEMITKGAAQGPYVIRLEPAPGTLVYGRSGFLCHGDGLKMNYSKQGLALTESFESCKLTAYQDIKGIWTIGYGHTGPEVVEGLIWTQNQADTQLIVDLQRAENMVDTYVTVPLTQGQYDALVDFAFNLGTNAERGSTLLKMVNENDMADAANQFQLWDHASGQVVAGLLRRRIAEEQEFNS